MAEKHRKLTNDASVREKIKMRQLVELLENHAFGLVNLEKTRLRAAEILLRKTLPDIQVIQVDIDGGVDIRVLQVASHPKPPAKKRASKPAK